MQEYFADLHIHIGAGSNGQAVKVTASRKLNFHNILKESAFYKGMDLIGIIDAASPLVINDIEVLLSQGEMKELTEGGINYRDQLVIILGAEVESREDNGGQAHYLGYFPYLENLKEFSSIMEHYITNINLSSQSTGLSGSDILQIIDSTGGIMVPAHVFTPHKSFYGRSFTSYQEVFSIAEWEKIPAIELGLSADTYLADYLAELNKKTFISNSDAHSLAKIGREYNKLKMKELSFQEFKLALGNKGGRGVAANYGLEPKLGKYHRSFCDKCNKGFNEDRAVYQCPECNGEITLGVKDRILNISDQGKSQPPIDRPPYIHQIPLMDIPGIGPKTLQRLLASFGTEMEIIHKVEVNELLEVVGEGIAGNIDQARQGKMEIITGGGGIYGKVMG